MDCREAESKIQKYISHELTMEELEEFISHVKGCRSCYEELETYFTVNVAIQHLDGDLDEEMGTTMHLGRLLLEDLKSREAEVRHWKIQRKLTLILFCGILCLLIGVILWFFLA